MPRNSAAAHRPNPSNEWRPKLGAGLHLEVIEGEAIVLDRDQNRVHHLNEVATFIVGCCDGYQTPGAIVASVAGHFDVEPAAAESDTIQLLAGLRELHIVV